ncbi:Cytochrome b5 reductase 4 [Armadillidium nasatum]|uniref:Cytochrome b5 reductase 4 n=1 Tax=Armadillidium nasatum TaxID=96803 RepID=A0A5N5SV12_9CRUS|nr:Cytochrome b5 reductase 4 [Armadillidium nasatum]
MCEILYLVVDGLFPPSSSSSFSLLSSNSSSGKSSSVRFPKIDVKLPPPKYDWFQTKAIINIAIYTKWKDIRKWHVIVVNHEKYLKTLVYIREDVFTVHLELLHKVERDFELKIGNESGKVDILLKKVEHGLRWCSIGKSLPGNNDVDSSKNKEVEYVPLEICEKTQVTHNSYIIELQVPHFVHFEVPVGHHVYLRIPDSNIVKPYTPIVTPFLVENKSSASICNQNIKIYFKGVINKKVEKRSDMTVK